MSRWRLGLKLVFSVILHTQSYAFVFSGAVISSKAMTAAIHIRLLSVMSSSARGICAGGEGKDSAFFISALPFVGPNNDYT